MQGSSLYPAALSSHQEPQSTCQSGSERARANLECFMRTTDSTFWYYKCRRGNRKQIAFLIKLFAFRLATITDSNCSAAICRLVGASTIVSKDLVAQKNLILHSLFAWHQGIDRVLYCLSCSLSFCWVCVCHSFLIARAPRDRLDPQ